MRWHLNPLVELHWRGWANESVAFDRVSGEMVACDALEAALMACIESGPQTLREVHDLLASDLGVEASPELAERLQGIIAEFASRGWIELAA